jgi:DNA repair exonuclease SbcCD nuclease subunit
MCKYEAVLISDVHYNINTLEIADRAMRMAIAHANELGVPLIVAGDLHDTKANIRGECIKAMIATFNLCHEAPYVLRGNHDAINEHSEEHSLEFLRSHRVTIIDAPLQLKSRNVYMLPYYHDAGALRQYIKTIPKGSTVIMHQGLSTANMGDYIQDKSALSIGDVAGLRVISGHYHTRQDIVLPKQGLWSFIGNPYTLTWGEANDPAKGFQLAQKNWFLEFIPTNLRKHVIITIDQHLGHEQSAEIALDDLVLVKVQGNKEFLVRHTKESVAKAFGIVQPFRFELIESVSQQTVEIASASYSDILDETINAQDISFEQKERLKTLWRTMEQQ